MGSSWGGGGSLREAGLEVGAVEAVEGDRVVALLGVEHRLYEEKEAGTRAG